MTRTAKLERIAILGHVGITNLGDESIIAAVIQNIRTRCPAARMQAFTLDPDDTRSRHGIEAHPVRRPARSAGAESEIAAQGSLGRAWEKVKALVKRSPGLHRFLKGFITSLAAMREIVPEIIFLFRCHSRLHGTQLLIIAGSQQMIDFFGGIWGFPYTLLKWTILARISGARVVALSVGAGPLNSWLGKRFVRAALGLMDYRSYRGESSKRFLLELKVPQSDLVAPDLAFSLATNDMPNGIAVAPQPVVGLNPMPYCDVRYWPAGDPAKYQEYIGKLAAFASWLMNRGYAVMFFPTQLRGDPLVIQDIRSELLRAGGRELEDKIVERKVDSVGTLLAAISSARFIVASRFHGIVLSSLLKKPLLGLAYHNKSIDLMTGVGQANYVVDIQHFDVEMLKERFASLEIRSAEIEEELALHTLDLRQRLDVQYRHVLS